MSESEEIYENLISFAKQIVANGPRRVLVEGDFAESPRRAREIYGIAPDIVFIRNDGWSLGAPDRLAIRAERLWDGHWIGVLIRPDTKPITMDEYEKIRDVWQKE